MTRDHTGYAPICLASEYTGDTDEAPTCTWQVEPHRRKGFTGGRVVYDTRKMRRVNDPRIQVLLRRRGLA